MKSQKGEAMLWFHPCFDIRLNYDGRAVISTLGLTLPPRKQFGSHFWVDPRATEFGQKEPHPKPPSIYAVPQTTTPFAPHPPPTVGGNTHFKRVSSGTITQPTRDDFQQKTVS